MMIPTRLPVDELMLIASFEGCFIRYI
jgi:hypothetical protein